MLRLMRLWRLVRADAGLLWFALRHPLRPMWLWPATVLLACYALDPFNVIVPLLGIIDDVILFPLLLHLLVRMIPDPIRAGYGMSRVLA
jgi:uncharacterized membrane protein YkvA (DUF1232 family)